MNIALVRLFLFTLLVSTCRSQSGIFDNAFEQDQVGGNNSTSNGEDSEGRETLSPTTTPTISPTNIPTIVPVPSAPVTGVITLKLMDTPDLLIGQLETDILNAVDSFLLETMDAGIAEGSTLEVTQIGLLRQYRESNRRSLISQDRTLQDGVTGPLFIDLKVTALHSSVRGAGDLDVDALLNLLFTTYAEDFVEILHQESQHPFLDLVEKVEVVVATTPPIAGPVDESKNDYTTKAEEDGDFWSIGTIVGVAAAGAVTLLLLLAILCRLQNATKDVHANSGFKKQEESLSSSSGLAGLEDPTDRLDKPKPKKASWMGIWPRKSTADSNRPASQQPSQNLVTVEYSRSPSNLILQQQTSDLESQGYYSYVKNESDSITGGASVMQNSAFGQDDVSYAYSLQAGLDSSIAPGYSTDQSSIRTDRSSIRFGEQKVPKEIPQISIPAKGKSMSTDISDTLFENRTMEESHEVQLVSSDLHLTESDLALLPSNLRDSFEEKSRSTPPPTRVIMAPSGKLGIIIDTTIDGPVVHHVNKTSALKGKIFPGDIIVAIDNVDTRAMSASAITGLMVKTAKQKRRLTVLDSKELLKKKVSDRTGR